MTTSLTGGSQFNGNINGMKWRLYNGGSNQYKGYNFTYDGLNRLTKGDYGTYSGSWANTPAYDLTSVTYDANGNITALTRKNSGGTDKDNFSFTLNGNQLGSISGTSNGNYSYDTNGNVTEDRPKGLSVSYYHELDLPRRYYYYLSAYSVFYQHDATGVKWSKRNFVSGMSDTTLYYGPFIYESGNLSKVLTPEGYYEPSTGRYHYYLKDHLGNTRITYYYSGSTSIVVQEVEYYPFGSLFSDNNLDKNRYLYQGKELENEMGFGIYDFHVRGYDPNIIRTRQLDPKAESYYSWSPYSWAANNPIIYIDPNGREIWIYYNDPDGNQQKLQYTQGMKYKGNNAFVSASITALNQMNSTEIGGQVLGVLIGSGNQFNFTNTFAKDEDGNEVKNALSFAKSENGGGEIHAGALIENEMQNGQKLESTAHELFHGYQYEKGQTMDGSMRTVNNEVGAYLFGRAVYYSYNQDKGFFEMPWGNETQAGYIYNSAMNPCSLGSVESWLRLVWICNPNLLTQDL